LIYCFELLGPLRDEYQVKRAREFDIYDNFFEIGAEVEQNSGIAAGMWLLFRLSGAIASRGCASGSQT